MQRAQTSSYTAKDDQYTKSAMSSGRRWGRLSTSGSARRGDTPAALLRCTLSGSHNHAMTVAISVTPAAAQMGAAPLVPLTSCMAAPLALPTHTPTV